LNNKTYESIEKYCFIYLLDQSIILKINNIEIIVNYLNINNDSIPFILLKRYYLQEFMNYIKFFVTDFKNEKMFNLILENCFIHVNKRYEKKERKGNKNLKSRININNKDNCSKSNKKDEIK